MKYWLKATFYAFGILVVTASGALWIQEGNWLRALVYAIAAGFGAMWLLVSIDSIRIARMKKRLARMRK